ncbi:MAG: helix-turn-helix domain-containing protein, partial [Gemmatimonadaceae bacterium]
IEPLALHFLHDHARQQGLDPKVLEPEALEALKAHSWPGNVRELKNVIENAAILSEENRIRPSHLMIQQRTSLPASHTSSSARVIQIPPEGKTLDEIEHEAVALTLGITKGNQSAAARILGISRPTLARKMRGLARRSGEADLPA